MNSRFQLRKIKAQETHAVRHPMLRKGRPLSSCVFEGDEDPKTIHLGAFTGGQMVGVLSAYAKTHPDFKIENSYQVRGVAVLPEHHRNGVGRLLMNRIEEKLFHKEISFIWLNARIAAVPFYQQLQYTVHGSVFDLPPIGLHYCYFKHLT